METICPNCGNHDTIYLRSGGALVCRACWLAPSLAEDWDSPEDAIYDQL